MISPETIALVRERTDILAIISEAVPSLKRHGRSWSGLCPFHKEKTPSFHVNPDRGFFHCFGCKESGSAIDFLIRHDGYTFPEAVRALAERAGITVEETKGSSAFGEVDRQKKAREDLYAVNQLAATFFEEQLRTHEHRGYAIEELTRRALTPGTNPRIDQVLQAFRIGYAPSGWDGLATFLRAQGVSPVAAETVGLLVPRSSGSGYYDRFRHRLMFAVVDAQGRVVAFSGRVLRDLPGTDSRDGDKGPPPKYINSPESPIYTKGNMLFGLHQARHAIRQKEEAVLVEGNFDVVSLHAHGIDHVVAPLGTAFTEDQAKLVKRFAKDVVFLFDGDAAGRKAVRLSRDPIRAAGIGARVVELPTGMDPDELVRTRGEKAMVDLLASAKGMLEALIESALDESFNQADFREQQARIQYIIKLIAEEDDPMARAMAKSYADMIAGRLDVVRRGDRGAFAALEQQVRRGLFAADVERRRRANQAPPKDPEVHEEIRSMNVSPATNGTRSRIAPRPKGSPERTAIVGLLIEWPVLLNDPDVSELLALLEGRSVTVVTALRRALRAHGTSDVSENALDHEAFLENLEPNERAFAAKHLANPSTDSVKDAKGYLLDHANKLKRLLLSQEAAQITRETYRAQGDWDAERELAREASERLRAKHGLKT